MTTPVPADEGPQQPQSLGEIDNADESQEVAELVELIEAGLDDVELSEDKREQMAVRISRTIHEYRSHRGPLPSPEYLEAYKAIDPRFVDLFLDAATENRRSRIGLNDKFANSARMALVFTFILALALIGVAAVFAFEGRPLPATLFGGAGAAPILIAIMRGGGDWRGRGKSEDAAQ